METDERVEVAIVVSIDPANEELRDLLRKPDGFLTFTDVVRSEVESNLRSISYVRHVEIVTTAKGGEL
jgi:hypothetical protein